MGICVKCHVNETPWAYCIDCFKTYQETTSTSPVPVYQCRDCGDMFYFYGLGFDPYRCGRCSAAKLAEVLKCQEKLITKSMAASCPTHFNCRCVIQTSSELTLAGIARDFDRALDAWAQTRRGPQTCQSPYAAVSVLQ